MLQSFQKWSGATSQHLSPLTRAATKGSPEMCQALKNSTAINWVKGVSTFAHCCGGQDMTRLLEPDQNPLMNTVKGRSSARKSGAFLPLKYNCLLQTGKSADTTDSPVGSHRPLARHQFSRALKFYGIYQGGWKGQKLLKYLAGNTWHSSRFETWTLNVSWVQLKNLGNLSFFPSLSMVILWGPCELRPQCK